MRSERFESRQEGIVLITAVMFLIVLSLLVISLVRTGILEERMVGASREWNTAFQAAEAALRDAEREIKTGSRIMGESGFENHCSSTGSPNGAGLCLPNKCIETDTSSTNYDCDPIWVELGSRQNDAGWLTGTGTSKSVQFGSRTGVTALGGVGAQPRYIIEVLTVKDAQLKVGPNPSQKYYYRATAVGFGADVKTRVMLQGTYRQY